MDFAGESMVVSANGETMIKVDDTEQIIYAEIDMREVKKIRKSKPYMSLRRTDCYL